MAPFSTIAGNHCRCLCAAALSSIVLAAAAGCASATATADTNTVDPVEISAKDPSWYSTDSSDLRRNSVDDRIRLREVWSQNSADRYPAMSTENKILRGAAYGIPISF